MAIVPIIDGEPKRRFTGALTVDSLVVLTDDGASLAPDTEQAVLGARNKAAVACLTGDVALSGRVWFVGRISTAGTLEERKRVESDVPDETNRCIDAALDKLTFEPFASPRAISFTLHFRPEMLDEPAGPSTGTAPRPSQAVAGHADDPFAAHASADGTDASGPGDPPGSGTLGWGSIGSIGTIGTGSIDGIGLSPNRSGVHPSHVHPPSIRQGQVTVDGGLPVEAIRRIVRRNFGRYRLCYEQGLRNDPVLQGRISVRFTIARDGSVTDLKNAGSDLHDKAMVDCVVRAFGGLSFPEPEGSAVTVTYPISFFPEDDALATPVPPKAFTVAGRKIAEVDVETLASMVKREKRLVVAMVMTARAQAHAPYALFVRDGERVYVMRRLQSTSNGHAPLSRGSERVGTDGWSFRIEGETSSAEALMASLVDP